MELVTESSVIQWGKLNVKYGMEKIIFTVHKSVYWLKKRASYQSLFHKQIETWDPLVEKGTV